MSARQLLPFCTAIALFSGSAAYAQENLPPPPPAPPADMPDAEMPPPAAPQAYYPPEYQQAREEWLAECRRRHSDNGLGGALIGGAIGGFAGNRIAGKGNRTVGTIAGAAAGAMAGAAIDKAEDSAQARDACEDYLAHYSQPMPAYGHGYPAYPGPIYPAYGHPHGHGCCQPAAYGYAYGPVMMVPVMLPARKCHKKAMTEEVVEERPARRYIPAKRVPDKRVKITPN